MAVFSLKQRSTNQNIPMRIFFLLFIFGFSSFNGNAQKEVWLAVSHFLGNDSFALERPFKNNLDYDIKMSRFDYYISNVSLFHDGGKEVKVSDIYILSKDGKNFQTYLGSFPISGLDSVAFYVGVDSVNNHADPALWPSDHALAPTFPDMHWGWAAGYRFSAIEGNNGPDYFYQYQLHPIGDELFYRTLVPTKGKIYQDTLLIELKADCAKSLDNINFSKVVFDHGAGKDAINVMKNFAASVFKAADGPSAVETIQNQDVLVTPNPTNTTFFVMPEGALQNADVISVYDRLGRLIMSQKVYAWPYELSLQESGSYFAQIMAAGKILGTVQLVKL
jgi:hypothetical protein